MQQSTPGCHWKRQPCAKLPLLSFVTSLRKHLSCSTGTPRGQFPWVLVTIWLKHHVMTSFITFVLWPSFRAVYFSHFTLTAILQGRKGCKIAADTMNVIAEQEFASRPCDLRPGNEPWKRIRVSRSCLIGSMLQLHDIHNSDRVDGQKDFKKSTRGATPWLSICFC